MNPLEQARLQRDAARHDVALTELRLATARSRCREAAIETLVSPTGLASAFALGWFTAKPLSGGSGRRFGFVKGLRRYLLAAITSRRVWAWFGEYRHAR